MLKHSIPILLCLLAVGCGGVNTKLPNTIILVTGAGGDGPWYDGLRSLSRDNMPVQTFSWGVPLPIYMLNLQTPSIHDAAEEKLAGVIEDFRRRHPEGKLDVIAHSAGCGVTLGALERLPANVKVNRVILLAPSVSPTYDLSPAIPHLSPPLHVFYSDRDNLWLRWRTNTFGTYDNIKTPAAGHDGFTLLDSLSGKVNQHPYDPAWKDLGNDGDHGGTLSREFALKVLAQLLN
jgi:pimeloyl-ACP methyl ester carboxylesterase